MLPLVFLTRLGRTQWFCNDNIPYYIFFFFSYVVVLRYLGQTLIPSLRGIFSPHYCFNYNVIVLGVWKNSLLLLKKYFTILISFQIAVFHRFLEKMVWICNTFLYDLVYPGCLRRILSIYLNNIFYLVSLLLFCMFLRVLAKPLLHSQVQHFHFSNMFIEIKNLSCYIFILFHLLQIPRQNHVNSP